jgi:hypothetical protein
VSGFHFHHCSTTIAVQAVQVGECWYNKTMKREYPEAPIAGVGVVVLKGDKVLLVRRGKEPGRGRWGLAERSNWAKLWPRQQSARWMRSAG